MTTVTVNRNEVTVTPTSIGVDVTVATGSTSFLGLSDTPDTYSGQGGKTVTVKSDETGVEFTTSSGGGGSITIEEVDGNPSFTLSTLKVPNGTLTNGGSGVGTLGGLALTGASNLFSFHQAIGADSAVDDGSLLYPGTTFSTLLSAQEAFIDFTPDYVEGMLFYLQLDPSADVANSGVFGLDFELETKAGNSKNFQDISGLYASVTHNGSGTAGALHAMDLIASSTSAAAVSEIAGLTLTAHASSGANITASYGAKILFDGSGAGIGTAYGVYIGAPLGGTKYALWTEAGHVRHKAGANGTVALGLQRNASGATAHLIDALDSDGTTVLSYMDKDGVWSATAIPDLSATYLTPSAAAAAYQPLDGDLTALAALSSTGFAQRTGSNTWSVGAIAESDVTNLTTDLAAKAPLASPALTGTPTAPTATAGDNSTQIATTAFVTTAVASGGSMTNGLVASYRMGLVGN